MSFRKLCLFSIAAAAVILLPAETRNEDLQVADSTASHRPVAPDSSFSPLCKPADRAAHSPWVGRMRSDLPPILFLPVQSKNAKDLAPGKVLVASRNLGDPNFVQTVVLLVHYDAAGVVGLIVNRRSEVPLSRVLEGMKAAKDRSDPVYLGGPVETPSVFALLQSATKIEGAENVFGSVYLISSKSLFEQTISAHPDPGGFHVYLGYAGWTAEQLRNEVELGAWFIFPGDVRTVFSANPDSLWSQMIRKTELKLAEGEPGETEWDSVIAPAKEAVDGKATSYESETMYLGQSGRSADASVSRP